MKHKPTRPWEVWPWIALSLTILFIGTFLSLTSAQDSGTIATSPEGPSISLDTPVAAAYGSIFVKAFGVDLVGRRAQVIAAYRNTLGDEGEGFTVDITDSTGFTNFFKVCNNEAAILKVVAQSKGIALR